MIEADAAVVTTPAVIPSTNRAAPGVGEPYSLRGLLLYFLRLGSFGFGGPIALVGYMQRDLVEGRGWITEQEYKEGLALAQLAPGPLAAQLAIYLGWVRAGTPGAIAGATFVLGRRAVFDLTTGLIALATLVLLGRAKVLSEPILILTAGVVGVALRGLTT